MSTKSAAVVIFNQDKTQVVLQKREDLRIWTIPGGGIEEGETPEQAAIREAWEETGYRVQVTNFLGTYWRPDTRHGGNLAHVYIGHVVGGNPDERGWESLEVGCFDVTAMPRRTFSLSCEIIADALAFDGTPLEKTQRLPFWTVLLLRMVIPLRDLRNKFTGRA